MNVFTDLKKDCRTPDKKNFATSGMSTFKFWKREKENLSIQSVKTAVEKANSFFIKKMN